MKRDIDILSVKFSALDRRALLGEIEARLSSGKRTKIFTPNPQILLQAKNNGSLRSLLRRSDINIPDGIGLLIAAKRLGTPLRERIAGIDIAEDILRIAERKGLSVFLLGGEKGRANRAARALKERFPRLDICGCHNGYFAKYGEENLHVRTLVSKAAPDILFVCFGFPLQERWISENLHYLPTVKLAIGLGGSIDVWSGELRRAPSLFRILGMEWLWRTMIEPKRIKIFADIPKFLLCVEKQKAALRKNAKRL